MYRTWAALLSVIAATRAQPVGDTKQTFFCQPEGITSGAQPVCELLPLLAPTIDSESVVDVCIDRAEREVAWFQVRVALLLREARPCGPV